MLGQSSTNTLLVHNSPGMSAKQIYGSVRTAGTSMKQIRRIINYSSFYLYSTMNPSFKNFDYQFKNIDWKSIIQHKPTTSTVDEPITTSGKYAYWTRDELIMEFFPEVVFSVTD